MIISQVYVSSAMTSEEIVAAIALPFQLHVPFGLVLAPSDHSFTFPPVWAEIQAFSEHEVFRVLPLEIPF